MKHHDWLGLKTELPQRRRMQLTILSFVLPLLLWCVVSYVPWIWHPLVHVTEPGGVDYFTDDMDVPRADFARELAKAKAAGKDLPKGYLVNPIYLPAPHRVARAFYTAFKTPPRLPDEPWLHQSLGHSIRTIFLGFVVSSILGVPLGVLCGTYRFFAKLQEPFIEFFRYLPAPAFGALCVAVLGIDDAPKVAIIFIGTFFQQVLVIANTVRKVEPATARPKADAVLAAVDAWLEDPTDERRRAAMAAAEQAGVGSPAGCLGLAVFLCGGSLAPPHVNPGPEPAPYLYAKAIGGAMAMAAVQEPVKAPEYLRLFVDRGFEWAGRRKIWEEEK